MAAKKFTAKAWWVEGRCSTPCDCPPCCSHDFPARWSDEPALSVPGGQKGQEGAARKLVGAAGFEPATLCLAADPAFLRGLDYLFGIAAALLIVSEDSPQGTCCLVRGCLLIALPPVGEVGFPAYRSVQHTGSFPRMRS